MGHGVGAVIRRENSSTAVHGERVEEVAGMEVGEVQELAWRR